jgi:branched-chain amino acid transport system permease protein
VLSAIGVNEGRVRGLGFDPMLYKLVAFTIAGALAGLAGFLAATQYGFVNPAMLGWHQSGHVLVMVILGGMGTLFGPILGAFILELAHFGLEAVTEHWLLPMGGLVIAIVLALPKGVGGLLLQWCDRSSPLPLAGEGGEQREPGEGPHPPTPAARVPPSPASGRGDNKGDDE